MRKHFGDSGMTSWLGKGRVEKNHPAIQALGALDEAQAAIGLCLPLVSPFPFDCLKGIMHDLNLIMGQVTSPVVLVSILPHLLQKLDEQEKYLQERVTCSTFLIPVTSIETALNFARAMVRRAEREVIEFREYADELPENFWVITAYLNRLSSLLFLFMAIEINNREEKEKLLGG